MGNISEHFSKEQFACKCGQCHNEFRMSLTLIGILEDVVTHFNIPVTIRKGYVCEAAHDKNTSIKKDYYSMGKAVRFSVPKDKLIEVFRYLETFPEISGLGINLEESFIHIDLREKEAIKWIYQKNQEIIFSPADRQQYGLGEPVERTKIPDPVTIPVDI